jgi:hypothetical protein
MFNPFAPNRTRGRFAFSWDVVLGTVALSFMLGYFIAQQQEARKREQWAEILFRQAKNWLTESGRKTAGSVEHGLEYVRSAA